MIRKTQAESEHSELESDDSETKSSYSEVEYNDPETVSNNKIEAASKIRKQELLISRLSIRLSRQKRIWINLRQKILT